MEESPSGWAWQNQQPLVVPDLASESRFLPVINTLLERGTALVLLVALDHRAKAPGDAGSGHS